MRSPSHIRSGHPLRLAMVVAGYIESLVDEDGFLGRPLPQEVSDYCCSRLDTAKKRRNARRQKGRGEKDNKRSRGGDGMRDLGEVWLTQRWWFTSLEPASHLYRGCTTVEK